MLRASLINGNWLNLDADLSKHIETLTDPGVIEGFLIENNNILKPGKAWVKAIRSNGETIFVYVELKSDFSFSLTSGKLWIELSQEAIDNWLLNAEDGTGIASIKTWPSVPSQNFLLLASVTAGVVKDGRNLIPKVGQIAQRTTTLESKVEAQEQKVGKLEEAGAPDHLEVEAFVWEHFGIGTHYWGQFWEGILAKKINILSFNTQGSYSSVVWLKKVSFFDENDNPIPRSEFINPDTVIEQDNSNWSVSNWWTVEFIRPKRITKIVFYYKDNMEDRFRIDRSPSIQIANWGNREAVTHHTLQKEQKKAEINFRKMAQKEYTQEEKKTYQHSNPLILQYQGNYEDAVWEFNIWDVEERKEVQLQAIANGQPFDELELKLGKGGLPTTNLIVEIKRAKLVIKEKDNKPTWEKWHTNFYSHWHWEGEVLATAVIPHTQFAQEWNKLLARFDKTVNLNAGDLVVITLRQQDSIVNPANYYKIAYDAEELSEWFSIVTTNPQVKKWSMMPYYRAKGFVSRMLVCLTDKKVKHQLPQEKTVYTYSNSFYKTSTPEVVFNSSWVFKVKYHVSPDVWTYAESGKFTLYVNNVPLVTRSFSWYSRTGNEFWAEDIFNAKKGKISLSHSWWGSVSNITVIATALQLEQKAGIKVYPRGYSLIGEKLKCTSFWFHFDWSWIWTFTEGLSKTVTTGNVTLWGALWFLPIQINGEVYKIPVYGA